MTLGIEDFEAKGYSIRSLPDGQLFFGEHRMRLVDLSDSNYGYAVFGTPGKGGGTWEAVQVAYGITVGVPVWESVGIRTSQRRCEKLGKFAESLKRAALDEESHESMRRVFGKTGGLLRRIADFLCGLFSSNTKSLTEKQLRKAGYTYKENAVGNHLFLDRYDTLFVKRQGDWKFIAYAEEIDPGVYENWELFVEATCRLGIAVEPQIGIVGCEEILKKMYAKSQELGY